MSESIPEPKLSRVLTLSLMDGWCMTLFSGFCMSMSLLLGQWSGAAVGAIVMSCGITTLLNRKRLIRGDAGGMVWLLRAQLVVLTIVFLFVLENLLAFDAAALMAHLTPEMRSVLDQYGVSVADLEPLLKPVYFSSYILVMTGTLLFQGGLALFYQTRRGQVTQELANRVATQADAFVQAST
jgi:hypothetical protein